MYQFSIGKYSPTGNTLKQLVYIPAVILVTITLFNLLIALIRDIFLRVNKDKIAHDYFEIAEIINDY